MDIVPNKPLSLSLSLSLSLLQQAKMEREIELLKEQDMIHHTYVFSYYRMCSLTIECVLLL